MHKDEFLKELIKAGSADQLEMEQFLIESARLMRKVCGCEDVNILAHRTHPYPFLPLSTETNNSQLCNTLLESFTPVALGKPELIPIGNLHIFPLSAADQSVSFVVVFSGIAPGQLQTADQCCTELLSLFRLIYEQGRQSVHSADEASADLVSQLTHDFNAIVTLLKKENLESSELIARLSRSDSMLDDLLLFIREADLITNDLPADELIRAVIETVSVPDDVDLKLAFDVERLHISADAELFSIAFSAIVKNAIEALQLTGGTINICVQRVENKSIFLDSDWLQITVRDDGPGISAEFFPFIKNPFFTTAKHQGRNGLGLPLAEKLICAHGGAIDINSNHGSGTSVHLYLPLINNE